MYSSQLLLNNKIYSYNKIISGEYSFSSSFEERTLLFCQQWLNGQTKFEQKTSGSTGKPKLIKITRAQMVISAKQTIKALDLKANDVALVCVDPAYIAGKMMLVRAFEFRMQIVIIEPSSNPLTGVKKPFHFAAMVPMQFENVINNIETRKKLANCKAIIIGGAAVSIPLATQIEKIKCPVFATYGMTETISHIALKRLSSPQEDYYTTIGDVEIKTNSKEQLIIKGAITNNKELITNDRVQLISPTTFKWLGRIDNVINSGGIKIQLENVEISIGLLFNNLMIDNPFFIAKKSDAYLGDLIVLYIESKIPLTSFNIPYELKKYLDKFSIPKEIIYVPNFSKTNSGKINKPHIIKNYN